MSLDVPLEVVRAMRAETTDGQPVWLMKVTDGSATLRLANDTQSLIGPDGSVYDPYPFSVTMPVQDGDQPPLLRVTAYDIPMVVVDDLVRSAGTRDPVKATVQVVQRGVLQKGTNRHEAFVTYEDFEIISAANTRTTLQFDLTARAYFDASVAKYWFGPGDFPGLF